MTGSWNPASPSDPIKIEAANIYKTLLEGLLGGAYPKEAFSLGEKITATITLPAEWSDQLKKGIRTDADLKAFSTGQFGMNVVVPFTLKIDPTKDAFAMTATIDPVGQTAKLALAPGLQWKEPFNFVPMTVSTVEATTDASFSRLDIKAASEIDFFGKIPVGIEMTNLKGRKPDLKVAVKPDVNVLVGALKALKIPVALEKIYLPIIKNVKLGSFDPEHHTSKE